MPPYPYRCAGPTPLFSTQNDLFHFMRDSIASGLLRPCAHLMASSPEPRPRLMSPNGYGVVCERDSFRTQGHGHMGYYDFYDFYGCPEDCLLFEEDRRNTPWRPTPAPSKVPNDAHRRFPRSRAVRAAWITGILSLLGVIITVFASPMIDRWRNPVPISETKESPNAVVAPQVGEGNHAQVVQGSPRSATLQAGRDIIINPGQPTATPSPSSPQQEAKPRLKLHAEIEEVLVRPKETLLDDPNAKKRMTPRGFYEIQRDARSSSIVLIVRIDNPDASPNAAGDYKLRLTIPNRTHGGTSNLAVPERMVFRWVDKLDAESYAMATASLFGRDSLLKRTTAIQARQAERGLVHFAVWDVPPLELAKAESTYVLLFTDLDNNPVQSTPYVGQAKVLPQRLVREFPGITIEHDFGR